MSVEDRDFVAVVMAAGYGTRMKSKMPKVIHEVLGVPMTGYVLRAAKQAGCSRAVLVLSEKGEAIFKTLAATVDSFPVEWATQEVPRGTGDAVRSALPALGEEDVAIIINGDLPSIESDAIATLIQHWEPNSLLVGTARLEDPTGYGRIIRGIDGSPVDIREHKDCAPHELRNPEVNLGIYAVGASILRNHLPRLESNNAQGEYYLTDLVKLAVADHIKTKAIVFSDYKDLMGVNDRVHLAEAQERLRLRVLRKHMRNGVTIEDPKRVLIESGIEIGADTIIEAGVSIRGNSRIGSDCHIAQGSVLTDTILGDRVTVKPYSVMEKAELENQTQAGPFARLRPGTIMREGSAVGNFVEMKKTDFGPGSKAGHLSYLGDAQIGKGVNVGAGTITCNYDGTHKHKTILHDGVFVGSDTQFVAPVTVGEKGYVGAGTTVTQDVPAGALAVSRTQQENKEGWVARKAERVAAKNEEKS